MFPLLIVMVVAGLSVAPLAAAGGSSEDQLKRIESIGLGTLVQSDHKGEIATGFDRNLNTGGNNYDEVDWEVVDNTVYHSERYPSHVVLPVIPGSG